MLSVPATRFRLISTTVFTRASNTVATSGSLFLNGANAYVAIDNLVYSGYEAPTATPTPTNTPTPTPTPIVHNQPTTSAGLAPNPDAQNEYPIKLWHFDGTTWNNITTSVDTVNHTITGITSSLSPFAIGEKDMTPPTLTNFQLNPYVIGSGSSSTISVSAQDDLTGVHSVSYSLTSSSGQVTTGDLSFISPSGVWQASVSPATGVYAVKLTATDVAGNQSTSDNLYLAVYDPSAGYVTGGGWVIPDDSKRIGVSSGAKTNFGFNVKYLSNNSSNPDGHFEMNDKQDGLDIKSTTLAWLTVSGSIADFQ